MPDSCLLERYLRPLLAGDRVTCRNLVQDQINSRTDPFSLYFDLLWPAMEHVEVLFRADRINTLAQAMATRISRVVADQAQLALPQPARSGKRMVITCADGESEELGAQMCADLFEARGWEVFFIGGGVPDDEILSLVGQLRPAILVVFGSQPADVPGVRGLVDLIRGVGVNPTMNIMVSGGVFNRAEGLWKEVGADLYCTTAKQALETAETAPPREPTPVRTTGVKKRRRRRRPPLLAESGT